MGKFLEWFCGKDESLTSAQFSKMMKKMNDRAENGYPEKKKTK